MTPLEAARRLAEMDPINEDIACIFCGDVLYSHAADCPSLALPAIVRALEAAERMTASKPIIAEGKLDMQEVCAVCWASGGHDGDCPWQALVAALKGEEDTA